MAGNYVIPEKVHSFNVYDGVNRLVGVSGDVEIPKFTAMSDTISGAGIIGEYDAPTEGAFSSMQMNIPFRQLINGSIFDLIKSQNDLVLRAAIQVNDITNKKRDHVPMVVTVRGATKEFDPGKVASSTATDSGITKEVHYIKIVIDGETCLELDKFNSIYIIGGVDMLAKVRSQI
jgi:P2 family phage contractile tail tube protein